MSDMRAYYARAYMRPEPITPAPFNAVSETSLTGGSAVREPMARQTVAAAGAMLEALAATRETRTKMLTASKLEGSSRAAR